MSVTILVHNLDADQVLYSGMQLETVKKDSFHPSKTAFFGVATPEILANPQQYNLEKAGGWITHAVTVADKWQLEELIESFNRDWRENEANREAIRQAFRSLPDPKFD